MKPNSNSPVRFFVYGTLKRGQCRDACWPYKPQRVLSAWTLGRLFDLGEYPAMTEGDDRVWGEVWEYPAEQAAEVKKVLDEIEVTNQPGVANLYDRVTCTVTLDGIPTDVFTYRYARELRQDQQIAPTRQIDGQDGVSWSAT